MISPTTSGSIGTVFQQGVTGLNNSRGSIVEAASDIVRAGTVERAPTSTSDIVEPLIRIRQEQHVFDASARIIDVGEATLGALIDTKA